MKAFNKTNVFNMLSKPKKCQFVPRTWDSGRKSIENTFLVLKILVILSAIEMLDI